MSSVYGLFYLVAHTLRKTSGSKHAISANICVTDSLVRALDEDAKLFFFFSSSPLGQTAVSGIPTLHQ